MEGIDKKLGEILNDWHGDPGFLGGNVEAIRQAFIDAGWQQITGDPIPVEDLKPTMSFVGPGSYSDELLQHIKDDTGLMTGQEWYNRFKTLAKSSGYYSEDLPMMKLAREAANLDMVG